MPQASEINLLRAKTGHSAWFVAVVGQLKTVGIWGLVAVLALGMVIGGTFILLKSQLVSLTAQERQLSAAISGDSRKEALLLVLKKQVGIAGKVLTSQKQWGQALDVVLQIASPPTLSAVNVDDKGQLTLKLKASSIDEAAAIVARLMAEVGQNHVKNPVLSEFELSSDGNVRLTLTLSVLL